MSDLQMRPGGLHRGLVIFRIIVGSLDRREGAKDVVPHLREGEEVDRG